MRKSHITDKEHLGTLALYAFTFGAYGSELLGQTEMGILRQVRSVGIILVFMGINLRGTTSSGRSEDIIVYTKIALLGLLAIAGMPGVTTENLVPVFDQGMTSVFMAGALIFVAYEGFQLITNAVCETNNPHRDIPRAIYGSVTIVVLVYIALLTGLTALGGLELIAAFTSMTFLIVSFAVSIANFRLRNPTGSRSVFVVTGMALILATIVIMCVYLWRHAPTNLAWISSIYGSIILLVFALQFLRSRHV